MKRLLAVASVLLAAPTALQAAPVVYTFETPTFTVGQTTPLLNEPPNVGPATFTTSFVDPVTANAFRIFAFSPGFHSQFSGQFLSSSGGTTDQLVLTFNTPINQLTVDFVEDVGNSSPSGFLRLTTTSGVVNQPSSSATGTTFQGGTLSFSTGTPFTSATFQAFNGAGQPVAFAIDNLALTPSAVPEPATLAVFGALAAGAFGLRRRVKAKLVIRQTESD